MAAPRSASTRSGGRAGAAQSTGDLETSLTRAQRLALHYWMPLTRSLEERLVSRYRQALRDGDIHSPLIQNPGSMLVMGMSS